MKLKLIVLLCLVCLSTGLAADPSSAAASTLAPASPALRPELRGILETGTEKRFNLALPNTGHSEWAIVGESFGGWKLAEFRDADQTLVLKKDGGTRLELSLGSGHVAAADSKVTAAEAEAVLEKMKFAKIFEAALAPQRKALLDAANKIAAKAGLTAASGEAYTDYQKQAAEIISAAMDAQKLEGDVAQIYSNVYTKDELIGLGQFYDSPVGQSYAAKAPLVQQQLQAVMMPRLTAIVPQLQALAQAGQPAKP